MGRESSSAKEQASGITTAESGGSGADGNKTGFDAKRGRFYHAAGLTGVLGFLGLPGTGKTTLMLDKLWPAKRVIIYNTAGDFGYGPRQKPLPGFHFVHDISTLADWMLAHAQEQKENPELPDQFRVCFTPLRSSFDPIEIFSHVCRLVQDFGDCVFAVDEIWNFQTSSSSPHALRECMLQWRHYGLCLMWTAQIAQKVDKTLLTVSTEIYCGRLALENDLEAVRRNGRMDDKALDTIKNLPDWQFVHRDEAGNWRVEKP